MYETALKRIGLTEGETKVYLALLKTGETTTGNVISESGLSSGKIYEILNKLMKKGLVSFIVKEKTKHFRASSPRKILEYLESREKEIQEEKEELSKVIVELEKHEKPSEYSTTIYKGIEGYRTVITHLIKEMTKEDEWLALGVSKKRPKSILFLWDKFNIMRKSKKIKARFLFSDKESQKEFKLPLSQSKIINSQGITPIGILGKKVLIFNWKELSVIEIINQDIADAFKEYFNIMWKIAK